SAADAPAKATLIWRAGRREFDWRERDAANRAPIEIGGQFDAIDPRRADLLEGRRGTASNADVCAFDQRYARVEHGLRDRAQVRRRWYPGQSSLVVPFT